MSFIATMGGLGHCLARPAVRFTQIPLVAWWRMLRQHALSTKVSSSTGRETVSQPARTQLPCDETRELRGQPLWTGLTAPGGDLLTLQGRIAPPLLVVPAHE